MREETRNKKPVCGYQRWYEYDTRSGTKDSEKRKVSQFTGRQAPVLGNLTFVYVIRYVS